MVRTFVAFVNLSANPIDLINDEVFGLWILHSTGVNFSQRKGKSVRSTCKASLNSDVFIIGKSIDCVEFMAAEYLSDLSKLETLLRPFTSILISVMIWVSSVLFFSDTKY